jgi:hypothetical protein
LAFGVGLVNIVVWKRKERGEERIQWSLALSISPHLKPSNKPLDKTKTIR